MTPPVGAARASLMAKTEVPIPGENLDHLWYGPAVSSISPWEDKNGAFDASKFGGPLLQNDGINGNRAVLYDGTGDYHEAGSAMAAGSNSEHTFVAVVQLDNTDTFDAILVNGETSNDTGYRWRSTDAGTWSLSANGIGGAGGGTPTTDPTVVVGTYDGSTVTLDVNGTEAFSKSLSTPNTAQNKTTIGRDDRDTSYFAGHIGAVGHESGFGDATRRDELTNAFADAFGITV